MRADRGLCCSSCAASPSIEPGKGPASGPIDRRSPTSLARQVGVLAHANLHRPRLATSSSFMAPKKGKSAAVVTLSMVPSHHRVEEEGGAGQASRRSGDYGHHGGGERSTASVRDKTPSKGGGGERSATRMRVIGRRPRVNRRGPRQGRRMTDPPRRDDGGLGSPSRARSGTTRMTGGLGSWSPGARPGIHRASPPSITKFPRWHRAELLLARPGVTSRPVPHCRSCHAHLRRRWQLAAEGSVD